MPNSYLISRHPFGHQRWWHPWQTPPADHTDIRPPTPQELELIQTILTAGADPDHKAKILLDELLNPKHTALIAPNGV